ncbi:DNA-3-methyladenine glycosylase I [Allonocardiopsis opalescens]|uniref:DNA-3-methyladenine glycosylase I n=1 Tax=Allonocardiopsis opalescens TaxID=1144618 RepID=A0A2T0QDI6_9ACTN|nr:DNA-3-methyladenine glycosylase I [Allonocardiopsis opalescens]PRY01968.1 DNA-3-methyladenine glycosylase I [Allonocardiopsis opalescens]
MTGRPLAGPDGRLRCPWAVAGPDLLHYHDQEWGRPVRDDRGLYERIVLEAFQSGLSWRTILRKRDAFRRAFDGFRIDAVAAYGPDDVERLLADPGIIRNRAKIEAAVANARAAQLLPGGLAALIGRYAPASAPAPVVGEDVPTATKESTALAKELKRKGFRFVGPTNVYATMQAVGLVNDHLADCFVRAEAGPGDR